MYHSFLNIERITDMQLNSSFNNFKYVWSDRMYRWFFFIQYHFPYFLSTCCQTCSGLQLDINDIIGYARACKKCKVQYHVPFQVLGLIFRLVWPFFLNSLSWLLPNVFTRLINDNLIPCSEKQFIYFVWFAPI